MGMIDLLSNVEEKREKERERELWKRRKERERLRHKITTRVAPRSLPDEEPQQLTSHISMDPLLYGVVTTGDVHFFNELTTTRGWIGDLLRVQVSPQENTVLHIAASLGHTRMVEPIVHHCSSLLTAENSNGDTPLHLAARGGHLFTVFALINCVKQFSASSSSRDADQAAGSLELRYLLVTMNNDNNNALHEALKKRHEKVARFFIEQEPGTWHLLDKDKKSSLYLAVEAGFLDLVNLIVEKIARHNWKEFLLQGKSPATASIIGRRKDILEAILKLEPELSTSKDESGRTPLHYAAWLGYIEGVVYLLRESTASASERDKYGLSPLHNAASNGHVNVIQELLRRCPYLQELLDRELQNILHTAVQCGKENVVTYILETPQLENLINARDVNGRTPLHLATLFNLPKIVSILTRDRRIDMKIMDNKGHTAFDLATQKMETRSSFQERLTWIALKSASAPTAKGVTLNIYQERAKHVLEETKQPQIENYKDRVSTLLVVTTLIATITFAAGFTMPGGYNSDGPDKGIAILLKKSMFHAYVICNTISMYSSIIVAVALIWAQLGDVKLMLYILNLTSPLLGLALTMMSLAFMAGVYVAVSKLSWLAHVVLVMGLIFLLGILMVFVPLWFPHSSKYRVVRYISYYVFCLLIFVTRSHTNLEDNQQRIFSAYMST